jgi:hypothetical protein
MADGSTSDAQQDSAPPWHFPEHRSRGGPSIDPEVARASIQRWPEHRSRDGARAAATRAPGIRLAVVRSATAGSVQEGEELLNVELPESLKSGGGTKPKEVTATTLFGKGASQSVCPSALRPKFSTQGPPLDPPAMSLP